MDTTTATRTYREPWNKGELVGQKAPFKFKDIWALRVRLLMAFAVASIGKLVQLPLPGGRLNKLGHTSQLGFRSWPTLVASWATMKQRLASTASLHVVAHDSGAAAADAVLMDPAIEPLREENTLRSILAFD